MNAPAKPKSYYLVMDSEAQREAAQNLFKNINRKTRLNNGQNLVDALSFYNEYLNSKRGKA